MNIKSVLTSIVVFTLFSTAQAQESKSKKVVIIKKMDDNGQITESKQEFEGDDADKMIKELELEEDINLAKEDSQSQGKKVIKIEKRVSKKKVDGSDDNEMELNTKIVDGNTKEHYKIIKKEGDDTKVIEWNGDGEMPIELKNELSKMKISKNISGDNMEISIESEEEGTPNERKIVLIDRDQMSNGGNHGKRPEWKSKDGKDQMFGGKTRHFNFTPDQPSTNKVSLGVMIEDTEHGVEVTDIVPGSAAETAGLRRGDIVLKINKSYIFTTNGLLEALKPFNPNEKIKVSYLRDGKEKSGSAKLKARE